MIYPDNLAPSSKVREEQFAADIEEHIRPLVLHLRNCGFNTFMSCHHAMYIFISAAPQWLEHEGDQALRATKQWLQEHDYDDNVKIELDEENHSVCLWLPSETRSCIDGNELFPDGQKLRHKSGGVGEQWSKNPQNRLDFAAKLAELNTLQDKRYLKQANPPPQES